MELIKLRKALTDKAIAEALKKKTSTVQHYTQGKTKSRECIEYVLRVVQERDKELEKALKTLL